MGEKEFHSADLEVIGMVNGGVERHRAQLQQQEPVVQWAKRWDKLKRLVSAGGWVALGAVFLGAAVLGWMELGFAAAVAVACFVWAVHHYRRGY